MSPARFPIPLLIIVPILVFLPLLWGGTILIDDGVYYLNNPVVTQPGFAGLIGAWSGTVFGFEPVTLTTIWIDLQAFGAEAWGWYRLHSLLWFVAWIVAIFRLARWLTGSAAMAWVVAAICAVHPVDAPLVMWPALRRQVVCLALSFWSLVLILESAGHPSPRFWWGCLLAVLAAWSRFSAVMVPVLVVLMERSSLPWSVLPGWAWWQRWGILGGMVAAALVVVVLAAHAVAFQPYRLGDSLLGTLALDGPIIGSYLWHVVAPWQLTAYYGIDESIGWHCLVAWGVVVSIIAATCWLAGPQRRLVVVCWLAAGVALSPCLNLVNQALVMADHYQAPAMPFLALIAVVLAMRLTDLVGSVRAGAFKVGVSAAILLALSLGVIARAPQFKDQARFLSDGLEVNPGSGFLLAHQCNWSLQGLDTSGSLAAPAGAAAWMAQDLRRVPLDPLLASTIVGIPRLISVIGPDRTWQVIARQSPLVSSDIIALAQSWHLVLTGRAQAASPLIQTVAPLIDDQPVLDRIWDDFRANGRLPGLVDGQDSLARRQNTNRLDHLAMNAPLVVVAHGIRAQIDRSNGRPLEAAKRALFCLRISCLYFPDIWETLAGSLDDLGMKSDAGRVRVHSAILLKGPS